MLRRSTNELSIKPKVSARYQTVIISLTCVLVLFTLYGMYQYGRYSGNVELESIQQRIVEFAKLREILEGELDSTSASLVFAQRQQQIQDEAYKQMSAAYASAEKVNRYLTSSLDFYRSIISPEDNKGGPRIQDLSYEHQQGKLSFDITLVQSIKHKHQVRAAVKAYLYDQNEKLLSVWPVSGRKNVNFQYAKHSFGEFELTNPADGAKIKIEIQVQKGEKVERWFDVVL